MVALPDAGRKKMRAADSLTVAGAKSPTAVP
jgi:hypothetical protein